MENVEEKRKTQSQMTGLKAILIGRLGVCAGYDELTRQEYIEELREILNEIRTYGGLNIFWATENQSRACAVDRLVRSGKIIRAFPVTKFPFARYEIT